MTVLLVSICSVLGQDDMIVFSTTVMAASLKDGSVTRFLPQDLVSRIIDYHDPQIHAHRRTLTSCSRVCRGFSVRSQELLFAKIQLKHQPSELGGSQVVRFACLLNGSPHLCLYVKSLSLNLSGPPPFCSASSFI